MIFELNKTVETRVIWRNFEVKIAQKRFELFFLQVVVSFHDTSHTYLGVRSDIFLCYAVSNAITFCERLYQKFTEKRLLRSIIWYHGIFWCIIAISCGIIYHIRAVPFVDMIGIIFCWYHFDIFFAVFWYHDILYIKYTFHMSKRLPTNLCAIKCYHFLWKILAKFHRKMPVTQYQMLS